MDDFKPSQVALGPIPLVATMGKAEIEFAAAFLVYACAQLGDAWQAVPVSEVSALFEAAFLARTKPVYFWANPFVFPEPRLMVERGFAVFGESPEGDTIAFTEKGLAALQRYVRKEAVAL